MRSLLKAHGLDFFITTCYVFSLERNVLVVLLLSLAPVILEIIN